MARKANATVAASPASPATAPTSVVAQPQDGRTAVKKPMSIAERAKARGAKAAPTETKSKAKVPVVAAPPEIAGLLDLYVEAGARCDAAEGEMKIYGGQIRPVADGARIAEARKAGSVFKSIDFDGKVTYSWPDLKVGKIDNADTPEQGTKPASAYKAGLQAIFGDLYGKYFTEADSLVIKTEVLQSADLQDKLFRLLEGDPAVLQPGDKGDNVGLLFDTEECVETMKTPDRTCVLQADVTLKPEIQALANKAVAAGFLVMGNGRLCSKKAATATAVQNIAAANAATAVAPQTQITINPAPAK